eukprot:6463766-Amphidinium_carterae.1
MHAIEMKINGMKGPGNSFNCARKPTSTQAEFTLIVLPDAIRKAGAVKARCTVLASKMLETRASTA